MNIKGVGMNDGMSMKRDKLVQDLKVVINDAEALLRTGSEQLGDGASEWRRQTQDRLSQLRQQLGRLQSETTQRVREAGANTNAFVRENPWAAVGLASGIGLLTGFLMSRR